MNIKVGVMPGRLVEVAVEEGTSAREIFEIAGVEVNNHEIRLDGAKINIDDTVEEGKLLVAMKMIKGNMPSIKVGVMPGRLEIVEYTKGEQAINIFDRAGVELSNHEIRLDGNKISLTDEINEGNLLVAMKMIKGNARVFSSSCTDEEIEILLEQALPHEIKVSDVTMEDNLAIIKIGNSEVVIDKDMFLSIYEEDEKAQEGEMPWDNRDIVDIINPTPIEHECTCDKNAEARKVLEDMIEENKVQYDYYMDKAMEYHEKMEVLKEAISRLS